MKSGASPGSVQMAHANAAAPRRIWRSTTRIQRLRSRIGFGVGRRLDARRNLLSAKLSAVSATRRRRRSTGSGRYRTALMPPTPGMLAGATIAVQRIVPNVGMTSGFTAADGVMHRYRAGRKLGHNQPGSLAPSHHHETFACCLVERQLRIDGVGPVAPLAAHVSVRLTSYPLPRLLRAPPTRNDVLPVLAARRPMRRAAAESTWMLHGITSSTVGATGLEPAKTSTQNSCTAFVHHPVKLRRSRGS